MVLLIDFDNRWQERLARAKDDIPDSLQDRVFILGTLSEPEDLRKAKLGSYETIGLALATECREGADTVWNHPLLQHNAGEFERLRGAVCPILFP